MEKLVAATGALPIAGANISGSCAARYVLLIAVLVAALFAFPLVGLVDPFSLLVRGLTCWADPLLCRGANAGLDWVGVHWHAGWLKGFASKHHLLPFRPMVFQLAWLSGVLLAAVFALELVARRFWCRYLCPAGAMLGLLGSRPLLKRVPAKVCKSCGDCAATCRMGALEPAAGFSAERCNLCMDCVSSCPKGIVKFTFSQAATAGRDRTGLRS